MALDKSEGSNLWNPLAITVIGGIVFATPLTLVLVPAIYSIFEQFGDILKSALNPRNLGKNLLKLRNKILSSIEDRLRSAEE